MEVATHQLFFHCSWVETLTDLRTESRPRVRGQYWIGAKTRVSIPRRIPPLLSPPNDALSVYSVISRPSQFTLYLFPRSVPMPLVQKDIGNGTSRLPSVSYGIGSGPSNS